MITMSTKQRRSNVVTKALLITALASGIAGMQAQPAFAGYDRVYTSFAENTLQSGVYLTGTLRIADNDIVVIDRSTSADKYLGTIKKGELYIYNSKDYYANTEHGDHILSESYQRLGDAKSILGGSSSSGELSEEQKTIVKNLIANWPRFFRLVEKFFERNDDYNEYETKT